MTRIYTYMLIGLAFGMMLACGFGCTNVIVSPDGTVRYVTFLKDVKLDGLEASDGTKTLRLKGYNADETKAAKEMVSAAVEAAVKAAKP